MDPWYKVDYSWFIQEASMVVEKLPEVVPPSGMVPGRGVLVLPILEARRRRNRGENRDVGLLSRVSGTGCKYRPKGAPGGGPSPQEPWWRSQEGASPPGRLGRAWLPSGPNSGFRKLL